jgi:hypothetical protein
MLLTMSKTIRILLSLLVVTLLTAPNLSFAIGGGDAVPGKGGDEVPANPSGGDLSYKLENPLAFDSVEEFIVAILNVVIVLATPIVVLFIIFAGFKYVTAGGNSEKITQATQALTYAIIGGVLIIGAVAIAEIIKNLVTSFGAT